MAETRPIITLAAAMCQDCEHYASVEDTRGLLSSRCTLVGQSIDDEGIAQDCPDFTPSLPLRFSPPGADGASLATTQEDSL